MLMPTVDRYMSREPVSVTSLDNLAHAGQLMRAHAVRHLPVIDDGQLRGVCSASDIDIVEVVPGTELAQVPVARVMKPALAVWSETPLDEVSELMTAHKTDCVVVRGGHGIEGIFTATDALQALAALLRRATS